MTQGSPQNILRVLSGRMTLLAASALPPGSLPATGPARRPKQRATRGLRPRRRQAACRLRSDERPRLGENLAMYLVADPMLGSHV